MYRHPLGRNVESRAAVDVYGTIDSPEDVVTGAHERWLFSTLYVGAKRVLTGSGAAAAEAEPVPEDDAPMSGVRTRDEVDQELASRVPPARRTKTAG